ncbi:hypothetical protein [Propionibacterium freudenreichii]|uniref:hypothetical protein n=1 Tax=Propionibacterium freudenreichii TaxID=1744 RepID=UPI0005419B7D|nr:hypothetical protein [Propionibacterium freudenreichii]MCT2998502.1 hypothetical protein [Propionibacterium freudenreichii]MCT3011331.1 hypothetical protein [Propionibacterium freudenreichii]MDK9301868.1 hypothetical protein [Propionibacterium freudenreichii]MDK9319396.1 hypothetical protein [Propionibacterium freudenreichii]MDK9641833.1 hypothetical protein [Propionibacterium freudenreichii]
MAQILRVVGWIGAVGSATLGLVLAGNGSAWARVSGACLAGVALLLISFLLIAKFRYPAVGVLALIPLVFALHFFMRAVAADQNSLAVVVYVGISMFAATYAWPAGWRIVASTGTLRIIGAALRDPASSADSDWRNEMRRERMRLVGSLLGRALAALILGWAIVASMVRLAAWQPAG